MLGHWAGGRLLAAGQGPSSRWEFWVWAILGKQMWA